MKKIVIAALLFSVLAGFFLWRYIDSMNQPAAVAETEQVVTAVADIAADVKLTTEMVQLTEVPKGTAHPRAARAVEEVVGRTTDGTIFAGEQIMAERLISGQTLSDGLRYIVSDGMRAYTVAVDDVSGIAGFLSAGDTVDVLISMSVYDETTETEVLHSMLAAQNVTVLAVGLKSDLNAEEAKEYADVTLLVTPEQAADINLAAEAGTVKLLLRGINDEAATDRFDTTKQDLIGE